MALRAGAGGLERPGLGISDVTLVVWAVNVLAVPASGKSYGRPDAARAEVVGQSLRIRPRAGSTALIILGAQAAMAQLFLHPLCLP